MGSSASHVACIRRLHDSVRVSCLEMEMNKLAIGIVLVSYAIYFVAVYKVIKKYLEQESDYGDKI